MTRAIAIASGLGSTSAFTWLKVPVVAEMERVMAASTLPALLLGGEVAADPVAAREGWRRALRLPTVRGLVVGRSLLYPPDGDVAGAVDAAVKLLEVALRTPPGTPGGRGPTLSWGFSFRPVIVHPRFRDGDQAPA